MGPLSKVAILDVQTPRRQGTRSYDLNPRDLDLRDPNPSERQAMAKKCTYCGKGTTFGKYISHAHNVTSRPFRANLQKVRAVIDGTPQRVYACTRCIRSGMVVKPAVRDWTPEEATT